MYDNKSFVAVIPARGGSKGIPRKNVTLLNGKPLIAYTIEAALESKYIDTVIVSTDNDEIAEVSKHFGANVIKRPIELAGDRSASIDALLHVLSVVGKKYNSSVFLQPTSPLRSAGHIDEAIKLYCERGCLPLASVSPVQDSPLLIRTIAENSGLTTILNQRSNVRRQDMSDYYKVNGAIYISKIASLDRDSSLNDSKIGYIMNQKHSIDIDDIIDLQFAEFLVRST